MQVAGGGRAVGRGLDLPAPRGRGDRPPAGAGRAGRPGGPRRPGPRRSRRSGRRRRHRPAAARPSAVPRPRESLREGHGELGRQVVEVDGELAQDPATRCGGPERRDEAEIEDIRVGRRWVARPGRGALIGSMVALASWSSWARPVSARSAAPRPSCRPRRPERGRRPAGGGGGAEAVEQPAAKAAPAGRAADVRQRLGLLVDRQGEQVVGEIPSGTVADRCEQRVVDDPGCGAEEGLADQQVVGVHRRDARRHGRPGRGVGGIERAGDALDRGRQPGAALDRGERGSRRPWPRRHGRRRRGTG